MAQRRSATLDWLVYLAVRLAVAVVQALPEDLAWAFAGLLARVAYRVDRRHRAVARENLRHAFPQLDAAGVERLVKGMYRHLATMIVEMVLMPRKLHARNVDDHVRYPNQGDFDRVVGWVNSGRPLLVVTGHFGNWEMFSYACGLAGFRGAVVARRLDNPYLDRFLTRFRVATGQEILDKNRDYDAIQRLLASGGYLGLVGDQDAGQRGVFVDFFGRPASTFKSIALLSLEYGAPVLVFGAYRRGAPLCYDLCLADVILPEEHAPERDPVRGITERYTRALERLVRLAPEQYFWLHRRWKHQPAKGRRKAA